MGDESRQVIKTSVRELVEFLLREGDIDQGHGGGGTDSMQEGSRIHRMIQRRMGGSYRSEVSLKYEEDMGPYILVLEGRADGVFEKRDETVEAPLTCVDEIKGVYRDVSRMTGPVSVHLAQAKCYAAMILLKEGNDSIGVQLTYCNINSHDIKRFFEYHDREPLLDWFGDLIDRCRKWTDFRFEWEKTRQSSIKALDFPFEFRDGQKELCSQVYQTIYHKKRLFLEAPTGVGKTISTIFPSVKAVGEKKGGMIFYLTAKTTTAVVAENTLELMHSRGLRMKTVCLTAKERVCCMEKPSCSGADCPRARGHYDRINDALFALITSEDIFSREVIASYAGEYRVCPYEMGLDLSLFADVVIGDYNYAFDPDASLKRFFGEKTKKDHIFLVDEAHNLVDRGREMYSAELFKDEVLQAKKVAAEYSKPLSKALGKCNSELLAMMREESGLCILENIDGLVSLLEGAMGYLEEFLEDEDFAQVHDELIEFYFTVRHFLNMAELLDENYIIYSMTDENGRFFVRLYCVNPSRNLRERMDKGISACLFSATLLPVTYYMDLLSGDRKDYAVYARSSFDPGNRGVFIATDVTSRYRDRGDASYRRIADYIFETVRLKKGNYMVFFPSYRFLEEVYSRLEERETAGGLPFEVVCQQQQMSEKDREDFLAGFEEDDSEREGSLVGMCVLGGIFSEGIDLRGRALIGALIVGTGIPQIGPQLDILKDHFDGQGDAYSGFDYAYRIPGMNKVMQAAGRVIRTEKDRGIIVLLDQRFTRGEYTRMFPREWENVSAGNKDIIIKKIKEFWENGE